jgi:membrane protein implicated in regulation of membrane protease activity
MVGLAMDGRPMPHVRMKLMLLALGSTLALALLWSGQARANQPGPVAAYSFDEGEGTTVEDTTGNGHTGTIEGATWTPHGRYGLGLIHS